VFFVSPSLTVMHLCITECTYHDDHDDNNDDEDDDGDDNDVDDNNDNDDVRNE